MRYPIQYIEIIRDKCSRTFGTSPCLATGAQCFNTIGTCKYLQAYNGTTQKDIFINPDNTDASIYAQLGVNSVYPFLRKIDHTPAKLNPASSKQGSTALGTRAKLKISLIDAGSDDQHQDPYFLARSGNVDSLGTFFSKYFARNKYLQYRQINWVNAEIVNGVVANKKTRSYLITEIGGPDGRGAVSIIAQDPLCLVELDKAKFPRITNGVSNFAVDAVQTSNFAINPEVVSGQLLDLADYPPSGTNYVRIDDEIVRYTSRNSSGVLSGILRGQFGTVPAEHSAGSSIQLLYRRTGKINQILTDILEGAAEIPAALLDKVQWQSEVSGTQPWMNVNYTVFIPEVGDLNKTLTDFMQQAGFVVYYDEDSAKVKIKVLLGGAPVVTLNSEENLIAESFKEKRADSEALTRVNVFVGVRSWTEDLRDRANYHSRITLLAGDEETQKRRGRIVDTDVFCYMLTENQADLLGRNTLRQFANSPTRYNFDLDNKDASLKISDFINLQHRTIVDAYGLEVTRPAQITKAQEKIAGTLWSYEAVNYEFFTMPDYQGNYFVFIPVGVNNLNLRTLFNAEKPSVNLESGDTVTFVVGAGVTIGSASAVVALQTGSWPSGVDVTLDCSAGGVYVVGRAGVGGNNEEYYTNPDYNRTKGTAGGPAMSASYPITIVGSAVVGGGGAGGFGGFGSRLAGTTNIMCVGGAGGGGAGFQIGAGGSIVKNNGFGGTLVSTPQAGDAGTRSTGGYGGLGEARESGGGAGVVRGGSGENGGNLGQSRTRGGITIAAGAAVLSGNNLITAPNTTFYGARNN